MAAADKADTPETVLMRIVQAVSERVEPRCRHFGVCGGCQLQDVPYDAQVHAKAAMLREVLQDAGVAPPAAITAHTGHPWEYRNRARFRVENGKLGYSRRASNGFLQIAECPILSPLIWRAAGFLRELAEGGGQRWPHQTDSVEIFANNDDSALQLAFHLTATVSSVDRDAPRAFRGLCDALRLVLPELAGAGLSVSPDEKPGLRLRVEENRRVEITRWGEPALTYTVNDRGYRVTRNAFFQVNRFLTSAMVDVVLGDRGGTVALDLFAGAGLFSVPLTERFREVIAVEIGEPAASDLAAHLKACGPAHRAVRSTVAEFLTKHPFARANKPDLIVLDPPRAGINVDTTKALLHTGARIVVYVSCNAATFARDAKPLIHSGYTLESLHLFDLFPQTFHTETIAVFRR